MRILKFLLKAVPRHPGEGIGAMSPESGAVTRLRSKQYPSIIKTVDEAEQDDPVARRVVETIAVLHASGVPRGFLHIPADEELDDEDARRLGFAGPEVDDVLVLTKQMVTLCSQRLGGAHPLTHEAQESVEAIQQLRRTRLNDTQ